MFSRFFHVSSWISGIVIGCFLYGFLIEPTVLKIRDVEIEKEHWPHDPLKIAFLADLHIGGEHVSPRRVSSIVDAVMAQDPDLILLGGDFIDGHLPRSKTTAAFDQQIEQGFKELGRLRAEHGVYAVIGNHDVWYDVAYVTEQLEAQGVDVLASEIRVLNNAVCVAGYPDQDTQRPNRAVMDDCPFLHTTAFIALMHSPDTLQYANVADLVLAGHTHGGQINLPLFGRRVTSTRLGEPFAYGLKSFNGVAVYITSGIGTSILPARFRAPPEIAIITLRGGDPESGPPNLSP